MKALTVQDMEMYTAGDFIGGFCAGIGMASGVYVVGVMSNWWNPVGWVSGAFVAADVACSAYYLMS